MSREIYDSARLQEFVKQLTSHQAALRAYILSQIPGVEGVGDILQEVNIVLWEKKASFEVGTNFRAWAFSITRYKILEHRRRLRRAGWLIFGDQLSDTLESETSEDGKESELYLQALEKCMTKLSPDERELLMQRYAREGSIKDFALIRGCQATALRTSLRRLRATLRKCILSRLGPDFSS